jgi:hypothetical protein
MQHGNPAEAGNHERVSLAEILHANPAVPELLDSRLIARNRRIAVNEAPFRLPLRPAPELQRPSLVLESLLVGGINDLDAKLHYQIRKTLARSKNRV